MSAYGTLVTDSRFCLEGIMEEELAMATSIGCSSGGPQFSPQVPARNNLTPAQGSTLSFDLSRNQHLYMAFPPSLLPSLSCVCTRATHKLGDLGWGESQR